MPCYRRAAHVWLSSGTEDVVPTTSSRSQPVAAAAPESLNISCEVTFRHGSLRLNGTISENILNLLIRELKR
ncbi:IS66 family insertion sequence element accessory protein TnpB [Escherichia coli]|nr:IS66 family insertion sequence element accessory protein TnpB [Escherichia coli]